MELFLMQNADSIQLFRLKMDSNILLPSSVPTKLESDGDKIKYASGFKVINEVENSSRLITSTEKDSLIYFVNYKKTPILITKEHKACKFAPGCAIKFYYKKKSLVVLFCFNCNVWAFNRVVKFSKSQRKNNRVMYGKSVRKGKSIQYIYFPQEIRLRLVDFAKKLHPNDTEFQNLK